MASANASGEEAPALRGKGSAASLRDVLLITFGFPPDTASGAARPYRFTKYLEKMGHNVQVVSAHAKQGVSHVGNVHRVEGDFDQDAHTLPWYLEKLIRLASLPHDEGVRWARDVVPVAEELFAGRQPVIVSTAPPLTTHLAAARLKSKHGWKWIADFRDPLAGNPYRTYPTARWVDPLWERYIFGKADQIIANTDVVADIWRRKHPQHAAKVHLLWNGFDPESPLNALPSGQGPAILRHVGTIYGDRFPTPLLKAMEAMFGQGLLKPEAFNVELAGPIHMDALPVAPNAWFRTSPEMSRAEADRLAASSHYLLLLDVTQSANPMQVPAKLFDYIRVGRPVLAVTLPGSPVERILKQALIPAVFAYPSDSTEVLIRKVRDLVSMPPIATPYSAWFADNFDGERQAAVLSKLIQSLG